MVPFTGGVGPDVLRDMKDGGASQSNHTCLYERDFGSAMISKYEYDIGSGKMSKYEYDDKLQVHSMESSPQSASEVGSKGKHQR